MLRKTLCRLLCVIAILCLTATSVFAAGWFNGADSNGSISFDFNTGEISVTGGSVELYMVARWNDEIKGLELCEDFVPAGLSVDELFGETAATALSAYVLAAEPAGIQVSIGSDGTGKAEDLALGVYLMRQETPFEGCEPLLPALISVPMEIDGEWILDVEASPKLEPLVPETTETVPPPETQPVPPPDLPPTGQVNWPVPVLLVLGCFLILLGLCVRRDRKSDET